ncbi:hypothetical protein ACN9MI_20235 [Rhodococcoides fascians]|uniref:hypothetical protein n=1 Tax=Rhodococcoides fascians TaxID=1828 RepID=UPI003CE82E03
MARTAEIRVSHQQFTIASRGVVAIPSGNMDRLVERAEGFLIIYTGTFWGPVKLTISTDANDLLTIDDSEWDAIEEGVFESSDTLQVETNDGSAWTQFENINNLPSSGLIKYRAHARGRVDVWGQDISDAREEHLLVLWPSPSSSDSGDPSRIIKSDGKNVNVEQLGVVRDQSDVGDDRVKIMGPFIFGKDS